MKKLNRFLNTLMILFFGVFIGTVLASYHISLYPQRNEEMSAPWYCYEPLSGLLLFIYVVLFCTAFKLIVKLVVYLKKKKT